MTEGYQQLLSEKGLVFYQVLQQLLKEVFLYDYNKDDDGEDTASTEGVISSGQFLLEEGVNWDEVNDNSDKQYLGNVERHEGKLWFRRILIAWLEWLRWCAWISNDEVEGSKAYF